MEEETKNTSCFKDGSCFCCCCLVGGPIKPRPYTFLSFTINTQLENLFRFETKFFRSFFPLMHFSFMKYFCFVPLVLWSNLCTVLHQISVFFYHHRNLLHVFLWSQPHAPLTADTAEAIVLGTQFLEMKKSFCLIAHSVSKFSGNPINTAWNRWLSIRRILVFLQVCCAKIDWNVTIKWNKRQNTNKMQKCDFGPDSS